MVVSVITERIVAACALAMLCFRIRITAFEMRAAFVGAVIQTITVTGIVTGQTITICVMSCRITCVHSAIFTDTICPLITTACSFTMRNPIRKRTGTHAISAVTAITVIHTLSTAVATKMLTSLRKSIVIQTGYGSIALIMSTRIPIILTIQAVIAAIALVMSTCAAVCRTMRRSIDFTAVMSADKFMCSVFCLAFLADVCMGMPIAQRLSAACNRAERSVIGTIADIMPGYTAGCSTMVTAFTYIMCSAFCFSMFIVIADIVTAGVTGCRTVISTVTGIMSRRSAGCRTVRNSVTDIVFIRTTGGYIMLTACTDIVSAANSLAMISSIALVMSTCTAICRTMLRSIDFAAEMSTDKFMCNIFCLAFLADVCMGMPIAQSLSAAYNSADRSVVSIIAYEVTAITAGCGAVVCFVTDKMLTAFRSTVIQVVTSIMPVGFAGCHTVITVCTGEMSASLLCSVISLFTSEMSAGQFAMLAAVTGIVSAFQ